MTSSWTAHPLLASPQEPPCSAAERHRRSWGRWIFAIGRARCGAQEKATRRDDAVDHPSLGDVVEVATCQPRAGSRRRCSSLAWPGAWMTPSRVIHSSAITLRISTASGPWIVPTVWTGGGGLALNLGRPSVTPCPSHARSSGHERYPADSSDHVERDVGLGARPWPGVGEETETAWHARGRLRVA